MAVTFAIDISHHQDKRLDLAQTRRDGCELCIMKAGQGATMVDPDFASNLAEAEAAGQLTAAYWFIDSRASAAAHLAKIKQVVPKRVALIPDVESIKDSQSRVISAPSLALTREVIRLVLAEGYRVPLMYLPRWYWQTWGSPPLTGLPPLWSSRYPDMLVGTLADEWADVPATYWGGYGGLAVALLQFTSSARIAGYAPLDASAFRGTRDQLAALIGGQTMEDEMLDDEERNWLGTSYGYLAKGGGDSPMEVGIVHAVAEMRGKVRTIEAKVNAVAAPEIDYAKLAAALPANFADQLAEKLADKLANRLAQ